MMLNRVIFYQNNCTILAGYRNLDIIFRHITILVLQGNTLVITLVNTL